MSNYEYDFLEHGWSQSLIIILKMNRSVSFVKDLCILFDSKLKFYCHIRNVINRPFEMLGFINRNCPDFTDENALKSIFCFLVRFICEYSSIIWSLYLISLYQYGHNS